VYLDTDLQQPYLFVIDLSQIGPLGFKENYAVVLDQLSLFTESKLGLLIGAGEGEKTFLHSFS